MIELELFYKTVEAKIREKHCGYLESEKRVTVPVPLPEVAELPTGERWKNLKLIEKISLKRKRKKQIKARKKAEKRQKPVRVEDKLLRGYNSGINKALNILSSEYERFAKRFEKEEKAARKF